MYGAKADAATSALAVRQSITSAYVGLQVANRGLAYEQEAYNTAVRIRDLTQKQFQAGAAPETSAIRAQIALAQEIGNLVTAITNVNTARATLDVAMGRDPTEPIDAAEPLSLSVIHPRLLDLQAQALRLRPEILSGEFARWSSARAVLSGPHCRPQR